MEVHQLLFAEMGKHFCRSNICISLPCEALFLALFLGRFEHVSNGDAFR